MTTKRTFWRVTRGGAVECRPATFRVEGLFFYAEGYGRNLTALQADGFADSPAEAWAVHIAGVEARIAADECEFARLKRSIPRDKEKLARLRALAAADAEKALELTLTADETTRPPAAAGEE